MKFETRVTRLTVAPEGDPTFSEQATNLEIADEAAGEYVKITQAHGEGILVTREEWPEIKYAIERLLNECREDKE